MIGVLQVWALSLPLPAVLLIAVGLYMLLLAVALGFYHCLKAQCSSKCSNSCSSFNPCDYCMLCAESCNCKLPSFRSCLDQSCPHLSCVMWDCACTCQLPDCESINCLCFEIKFR